MSSQNTYPWRLSDSSISPGMGVLVIMKSHCQILEQSVAMPSWAHSLTSPLATHMTSFSAYTGLRWSYFYSFSLVTNEVKPWKVNYRSLFNHWYLTPCALSFNSVTSFSNLYLLLASPITSYLKKTHWEDRKNPQVHAVVVRLKTKLMSP